MFSVVSFYTRLDFQRWLKVCIYTFKLLLKLWNKFILVRRFFSLLNAKVFSVQKLSEVIGHCDGKSFQKLSFTAMENPFRSYRSLRWKILSEVIVHCDGKSFQKLSFTAMENSFRSYRSLWWKILSEVIVHCDGNFFQKLSFTVMENSFRSYRSLRRKILSHKRHIYTGNWNPRIFTNFHRYFNINGLSKYLRENVATC